MIVTDINILNKIRLHMLERGFTVEITYIATIVQ